MGFEQGYVFTVRIKNIFSYLCTNVLKLQSKCGPGSFKCFGGIIKQKFITLLPALTWHSSS